MSSSSSYPSYPSLSSDQQKLLLAALTSNSRNRSLNMDDFFASSENGNQQQQVLSKDLDSQQPQTEGIDPSVFDSNPRFRQPRPAFGEGLLPSTTFDGNVAKFDVDVDLGQNDYDDDSFAPFDPSLDVESGEKRKNPEEDLEEDDEEGDFKRQEGDDKAPKKPGRKPLTSEPTTKRKAQNRAAQRAFRERKEKHLKDLEVKVSDLEHASESANHENELLRAQIVKLQSEIHDYRKRLSLAGNALNGSPPPATDNANYQSKSRNGANPYDFQFDFPAFGDVFSNTNSSNSTTDTFNGANGQDFPLLKSESASQTNSTGASPLNNGQYSNGSPSINGSYSRGSQSNGAAAGIFSPSLFNVNDANYGFPTFGSPASVQQSASPSAQGAGRSNSAQPQSATGSATSNAASPSNSSMSQHATLSSAGTSPEPSNGYPNGDKPKQNGTTNGLSSFQEAQTPQSNLDLSSFQFDPTLFGGYRETNNAILGDGDFTGGLYDDYLNLPELDANSFNFNNNNNSTKNTPLTQPTARPTLIEQVDSFQEECSDNTEVHTSSNLEQGNVMTAHKIWTQLSTCPKFLSGELDIDGLCSDLSKKATCSESGAVIPKAEWEAALWRMVGQDQPNSAAKPPSPTTK